MANEIIKKQMLSVRMPKEQSKRLGERAKQVGMSKCGYILSLVAKDLDQYQLNHSSTEQNEACDDTA